MSQVPNTGHSNPDVGVANRNVPAGSTAKTDAHDERTPNLRQSGLQGELHDQVHSDGEVGETLDISPEDNAEIDEVWENIKKSVPRLDDYLSKLLTLVTALIGGGLVLGKGDVVPFGWSFAAIVALFASLLFILYGLHPTQVILSYPTLEGADAQREGRLAAIKKKRWALKWSVRIFVLSLFFAIVGMATKIFDQLCVYYATCT